MKSSSRKWLKRILLLVATVMVVLLGGAMIVFFMARRAPEYYRPTQLTAAQRADAAKSAEDKFIRIQNEAARTSAAESARRHRATTSSTQPIVFNGEPITISFTEAELNAFFEKWSNFQNWKSAYEPYLEDPAVVLRDDRVIIAGKLKDLDLVVSLHFEPSIDEQGQLKLELARIMGGVLPLPEAMISKYQTRLTSGIARKLPAWQQSADIDANGAANANAIAASAAKLLVRMLRHEPAEPVLFLPVFGQRGSVPVRIQAVEITDGEMSMTIQPMSREEQVELLKRIRTSEPVSVSPQARR